MQYNLIKHNNLFELMKYNFADNHYEGFYFAIPIFIENKYKNKQFPTHFIIPPPVT